MTKFFIKENVIKILINCTPEYFYSDDNSLFFKNENDAIFIFSRLVNENYPDIKKIIEDEGQEFMFPTSLFSTIDRIDILSNVEYDAKQINIIITKNNLFCKLENEFGYIKENIFIEYDGPDFSFSIHPNFLKEVLLHNMKGIIGNRTIKFQTDNFIHILSISKI
jgi:DNA polymerase III sliding clamp (beta) subunit (PCNA family)